MFMPSHALCTQSRDVPQNAQDVFERFSRRVVKIEVLEASSGSKAGVGTGFFVSPKGNAVTNYHVISWLIYYPERYRANLVDNAGKSVEIRVLGVDVINDLAIVHADIKSPAFFELKPVNVRQGVRLYSLGHPHDIGISIVEGTYNGYLKSSFYKQVHFTGSLNPGMSGGPAITASGEVVGINVATAGNQVSFLVPVDAAVKLARKTVGSEEKAPEEFLDSIRLQLMDHQENYLDKSLAAMKERVEMGDYVLPTSSAPFIECWGDKRAEETDPYEVVKHSCSGYDSVFVSGDEIARTLQFSHKLVTTGELDRFRFYTLYSSYFGSEGYGLHYGGEEEATNFRCDEDFVESGGITFKTVFCVRGYVKLEGLYDAVLEAATLESRSAGLVTTLVLQGVSFDEAVNAAREYLAGISWKE